MAFFFVFKRILSGASGSFNDFVRESNRIIVFEYKLDSAFPELMNPKKLINNSGNNDFSSFNLKMNTIFAMRSNKILSNL